MSDGTSSKVASEAQMARFSGGCAVESKPDFGAEKRVWGLLSVLQRERMRPCQSPEHQKKCLKAEQIQMLMVWSERIPTSKTIIPKSLSNQT